MYKHLLEKYGNTVLITGASSGIGESFARVLAAAGMNLVLVARRADRLEKMATEFTAQHGSKVTTYAIDLALPDSGQKLAAFLFDQKISVDILINNAGYGLLGEFGDRSIEHELGMIDLNCRAVADLTHRFIPAMKKQRKGAVIITSSVVGSFPVPLFATYAATKAFDLYLGAALARELKPFNVDVLTVQPGLTRTEFQAGAGMRNHQSPYRSADQVVHTSLRALGHKSIVIDGVANKIFSSVIRTLPLWLSVPIVGYVMRAEVKRN